MDKTGNHLCSNIGEWRHCCICNGRIHEDECTSRKDRSKDCCPAPHKMLFDAGEKRGLTDDSMAMWSPEYPQGYHDPKGVL
jgi:hypothetical protein